MTGRRGPGSRFQRRRAWGLFLALAAFTWVDSVAAREPGRIRLPDRIAVDSCGYEYDSAPLCDGIREPIRWRESWSSAELIGIGPRWVELAFTSAIPVRTVAIFWGVEDGRPASSRTYAIQAWQNGAFTNVLEIRDNPPEARSVHAVDAVTSDRFRIWQPVGGGFASRTNAMCIAEIELYATAKPDADFGTPADLEEARTFQAEVRDLTIGVFRRSRSYQGRTGAIAHPLMRCGWRVIQLEFMDERDLGLCRAAVVCGTRAIPNPEVLAEYVRSGGGLMFVHDSCGRGPGSVFPEIWGFAGMGDAGGFALADTRHPITRGITNAIASTYGDYAVLKAGPKGTALVRDAAGRDVVVAGGQGKGRAIAIGLFPGLSSGTNWNECRIVAPGAGERAILVNAVQWLTQDTGRRRPWAGLFRSRGTGARKTLFEDVTSACGMARGGYSKNVAIGDVNNDGRQDIFVTLCRIVTSDPYGNLLYRNDGNWQFTETASQAGVTTPPGIGSVFGDVNGDGNVDLFVAWMPEMADTNNQSALYLGDGKGGFRNVAREAGLGGLGKVSVCMLADMDNDGDLDLYAAGCEQANRLYRNRGDGTFEDGTAAMGLADVGADGEKGYGGNMACGMGDMDGDGYADLIATSRHVLHVYRNNGGKGFSDVPDYMGSGQPPVAGGSLGLTLGDMDNDGDLDVYVAGCNALLRNEGQFRFVNVTKGSGLDTMERNTGSYGPIFADWNNDGRLDLFLGNGGFDSLAFQGNGDGTFADVSGAIGLDVFGVHGCNFGDLDGDGDLDFYATSWAKHPFALLRNNQDDGNALTIRVRGRKTNRSGVGAKVWVYTEGGNGGTRRLLGYREVRTGGGAMYSGAVLEQHVGVPRGGVCTVEAFFPISGERVTVAGVSAPRTLTIEEPGPAPAAAP